MVWIIGSALSVWAWYISEYSSDLLKYIDLLVLAGIFGGSTLFAWQINKKGDSEHFWRRYFSIDISLIFSVLVFVAVTNFLYSLTRALMDDGAYFDKTFSDATRCHVWCNWTAGFRCVVPLAYAEGLGYK